MRVSNKKCEHCNKPLVRVSLNGQTKFLHRKFAKYGDKTKAFYVSCQKDNGFKIEDNK
jgi:hypothetical protein